MSLENAQSKAAAREAEQMAQMYKEQVCPSFLYLYREREYVNDELNQQKKKKTKHNKGCGKLK